MFVPPTMRGAFSSTGTANTAAIANANITKLLIFLSTSHETDLKILASTSFIAGKNNLIKPATVDIAYR